MFFSLFFIIFVDAVFEACKSSEVTQEEIQLIARKARENSSIDPNREDIQKLFAHIAEQEYLSQRKNEMNWTRTLPTEPGRYLWHHVAEAQSYLIEIILPEDGDLWIIQFDKPPSALPAGWWLKIPPIPK